MNKLILITTLFLLGCSTLNRSSQVKSNPNNGADKRASIKTVPKLNQKALDLRAKEEKEQDRQDRARVASKRSLFGPAIASAVPQRQGRKEIIAPPSILNPQLSGMSGGELLAEIKDRYQAGDRIGFRTKSQAYLSKYHNGDGRDDVLYLKGMAELMDKNYGVSLVQFNTILRDNPNGRKAPAALFAKGMLYRKMNLAKESREALDKVVAHYPGSPESVRAKMELRLLR
jgi:hypothetical protein